MKKIFSLSLVFFTILLISDKVQAQSSFNYSYSNPIGHNSLTSFAGGILASVQGIAGWLTVIFIVIGGVMYLTAGGNDKQITTAKNTIIAALIGFTFAVGGPSLLKEIQDILTGSNGSATISGANSIYDILENVLDFILTLVAILALMALIYSGFNYLGANGDRNRIDRAKKIAIYSIVAIAVSGGSIIIIRTIINFLDL